MQNGQRVRGWVSFVRSAATGALATLADLAVLGVLVAVGVSPRVASFPALFAGAVVQFAGNRRWAFRAESGPLGRQVALFTLTEIVTLGLNALAFDLVARHVALSTGGAILARALTTNVVFLAWSFPVWRLVFQGADPRRA